MTQGQRVYQTVQEVYAQRLAEWRQREVDAMYEHLLADFTAALNTKPDDNSAAEAAVGYSLT